MSFPNRNNNVARVIEFFKNNPDEELTLEDMCAKFDMTKGVARTTLWRVGKRVPLDRMYIVRLKKT